MYPVSQVSKAYDDFFRHNYFKKNFSKNVVFCLNRMIFLGELNSASLLIQHDRTKLAGGDQWQLTPWHIAAITNNMDAARFVQQINIWNVDAQDNSGYTAMHHAAVLGNRTFIEFLKSIGASDKIRDVINGGTPQDILAQCYPNTNPSEQQILVKKEDQIRKETGEFFEKLTGAAFLDKELVISPDFVFKQWQGYKSIAFNFTVFEIHLIERYEKFRANSHLPKMYLDSHPTIGHLVRAGEKIPAFTIIGEYLGEIQERPKTKARHCNVGFNYDKNPEDHYTYKLNDGSIINSFKMRGMMAMLASSFPNVMVNHVSLQRGQFERLVCYTIEDVEVDEPLVLDYGAGHPVKKMSYVELRRKEMEAFFRGKDAKTLFSKLNFFKEKTPPNISLHEEQIALREEAKVKYLMTTPHAMLKLLLKRCISHEVARELIERGEFLEYQKEFNSKLLSLNELLGNEEGETAQKIKEELLDATQNLELSGLCRMMEKKIAQLDPT